MANLKSDVVTLLDGTDQSTKYVEVGLLGGRVRVAMFSADTGTASDIAVGEDFILTRLPAGARPFAVYGIYDAMSTSSGVVSISIGDAGDVDRLVSAVSADAASTGKWFLIRDEDAGIDVRTLGLGYKYTVETDIIARVSGEQVADNVRFSGFILYVVD